MSPCVFLLTFTNEIGFNALPNTLKARNILKRLENALQILKEGCEDKKVRRTYAGLEKMG